MRCTTLLALAGSFFCAAAQKTIGNVTTGQLGDAATVANNPIGGSYIAELPENPADGNLVRGSVVAQSAPDGNGVLFQVTVSNLPAQGGPFLYHIHSTPVDASGNCTSTLAHLDPYIRGEMPVCDASAPQTCQVGDLSGKHGKIAAQDFTASYLDPYASLVEGIGAFLGNRSITFHYANATRITCANFTQLSAGSPDGVIGGGGASSNSTATVGSNATFSTVSPSGTAAAAGGAAANATGFATTRSAVASAASATGSSPVESTGGAAALGFSGAALIAALGAAML